MKLDTDIDIVQWVFDSEFMMNTFSGPIDAREMCDLIRELHAITKKSPGDADEVREAWSALAKCVGPRFIGQFISCGTWRELCPSPDDTAVDADDVATVWFQDGKRVVARVVYDGKKPVGVEFGIL